MGEENKNVKKPAVSNAVVKKNGGNRNKSTGGTRPGNGTKSTGSTRPSNGAKSAGGTHTNKTGSGAKNSAAGSNGGSAKTAAYVQTIHQEERHSHKKEDAGE